MVWRTSAGSGGAARRRACPASVVGDRAPGLLRRLLTGAATLAALLAIPSGLIAARAHVVSSAPATARVYSALGLDVNLRGIEIEALKSTLLEEDGARLLVVEGRLKNVSDDRVLVPDLELSVRDAEGRRLYVWSAASPRPALERADEITFRTRLISPPEGATDVRVAFR